MTRVALFGLGTMGMGIAVNLIKNGCELFVYNRTAEKAKQIVGLGATLESTPSAAAAKADVIISVVGDDAASQAVWLGADGGLAGARSGSIVVECSTLSIPWVRRLAAEAESHGLHFADAAMAGSKSAAATGSLILYVGADVGVYQTVQPTLKCFSQEQIHFGLVGTGMTYKLINNMMAAAHVASLGEGMALAEECGLDKEAVLKAVTSGVIANTVIKMKAPSIMNHSHDDVFFALRWMQKDLTYALQLGDETGVPLPVAAEVREMFRLAVRKGLGSLDWSAIGEVYRR
ncbi:MAG TPA: NAD(P)-dependent oxidoreductase [Dissulfurispiraceae bacterium]|nr:NAD(P)-dependent oxidoreductase [Dissulfurispiraceae bacterium]